MEPALLGIIALLLAAVFALSAKVYFLRRGAREISRAFCSILSEDTNILIDISTRDKQMRKLAAEINTQLRELRRERRKYQHGDLELKEAVTNISHDLRTPLTAISGYLELLERGDSDDDTGRYIEQIRGRTEALKALTEELFRYSAAVSARELRPERMDIVRALEESLLSFYAAMQQRGIQPKLSLPEKPVWRELDPAAVGRVFANVISNAVKYSDGDFAAEMDDSGTIVFSNMAKELTTVEVGRLFDRFYTVSSGRSSTGLGLSIAKLLVEQLGGCMSAELDRGRLYIRISF